MQKIRLNFLNKKYKINIRDESDQSVMREIFKIREYRGADEIIKSAKEPIMDVGAHAGFFVLYARALNEKVKIFALEPETENAKMLSAHVKENKIKNVKIIEAALAAETGGGELIISPDSHNHHLVSVIARSEATRQSHPQKIQTYSLPDLLKKNKIKKISLLKMDIEGGEYGVIESLSGDDYKKIGAIILEYHNFTDRHFKVLENKLRENGFGVQIYPSKFDKKMGFLLARNRRLSLRGGARRRRGNPLV